MQIQPNSLMKSDGPASMSDRPDRGLSLLLGLLLAVVFAGCTSRTADPSQRAARGAVTDDVEPDELAAPPEVRRDDGAGLVVGGFRLHPNTQPWSFYGHEGQVLVTDHFRIYTTLGSSDMRSSLPSFCEGCLQMYRSTFGTLPAPRRRMETFLFRDKRQWRTKTREILPQQADAFMSLGRGGFATQGTSVLYYIGMRDTRAIAAHEGWHQYTQTTFRQALPVWLEEGIATYMEAIMPPTLDRGPVLRPWDNGERRWALRRAMRRDSLIPLDELLERTPQYFLESGKGRLLVYYAQVWALTRFLVEGEDGRYRPHLEQLVRDAAEGRLSRRLGRGDRSSGTEVLRVYFGPDIDLIGAEYDRFMRLIARHSGPLPAAIDT